jgi:hypothetical protein
VVDLFLYPTVRALSAFLDGPGAGEDAGDFAGEPADDFADDFADEDVLAAARRNRGRRRTAGRRRAVADRRARLGAVEGDGDVLSGGN